jgi:hypothetical protein
MTEQPNVPSLNCLVELATRNGVDIRPTLLRVMTDLYVQKPSHSPEEERHFTELALRLWDLVDASTRAIVADKIVGYANAPAAVRQRVLRDQIRVNPQTADAGPDADRCAGGRPPAEELSELFFAANPEERRFILLNLPYAPLPLATPIAAALAHEVIGRLETAALGRNSEAFARELMRALGISQAQARRLIDDPSGEPIVVAAVALAMPAFVLQRILLCLNPSVSQSVQRVYDLALLHEELSSEAALRLLAVWQASRKAQDRSVRPPAHRPHHWEAEPSRRTTLVGRPQIKWTEHVKARKADIG